jgi:hypothetical protein
MICITQPDGWTVFYADDGETEIGRVKLPDGCTAAELERFIDHVKREAARKAHGPS